MSKAARLVLEALSRLSPASRRRLLARMESLSRRERYLYKESCHPVALCPLALPGAVIAVMERLALAIHRLQARAPALWAQDSGGFAGLMALERRTQAWLSRAPAPAEEFIIRPDFGLDAEGRPLLYEFNSLMLASLYASTATRSILEEQILPSLGYTSSSLGLSSPGNLMDFLARWLLPAWRGRGSGGLAFLEDLPVDGGFSELPQITEYFRKKGLPCKHGDPRELELRGGRVTLRGMPVALAYRDFSFEDTGGPENARMKPFRTLWEQGRVVPGPAADFGQKGMLECLTSERFSCLFSLAERELFAAHVPWTRVLLARWTMDPCGRRVDLPSYALKNRAALVFKPSWESGGTGILIGAKTTAERWEKTLTRALATPGSAAVQAYVPAQTQRLAFYRGGGIRTADCRCAIGVFCDGERCGLASRISPREIVNVARGGALSAVYLIR